MKKAGLKLFFVIRRDRQGQDSNCTGDPAGVLLLNVKKLYGGTMCFNRYSIQVEIK